MAKKRLVITEIPYTMIGAGIGKFLNDVCALVETKKTNDIVDISNHVFQRKESALLLELKKGADVENLTNMLYKKTKIGRYLWGKYAGSCRRTVRRLWGLRQIIRASCRFPVRAGNKKI